MVGMVAGVEKVVVQGPVQPVIQKFNRPNVQQSGDDNAVRPPQRNPGSTWNCGVEYVE